MHAKPTFIAAATQLYYLHTLKVRVLYFNNRHLTVQGIGDESGYKIIPLGSEHNMVHSGQIL